MDRSPIYVNPSFSTHVGSPCPSAPTAPTSPGIDNDHQHHPQSSSHNHNNHHHNNNNNHNNRSHRSHHQNGSHSQLGGASSQAAVPFPPVARPPTSLAQSAPPSVADQYQQQGSFWGPGVPAAQGNSGNSGSSGVFGPAGPGLGPAGPGLGPGPLGPANWKTPVQMGPHVGPGKSGHHGKNGSKSHTANHAHKSNVKGRQHPPTVASDDAARMERCREVIAMNVLTFDANAAMAVQQQHQHQLPQQQQQQAPQQPQYQPPHRLRPSVPGLQPPSFSAVPAMDNSNNMSPCGSFAAAASTSSNATNNNNCSNYNYSSAGSHNNGTASSHSHFQPFSSASPSPVENPTFTFSSSASVPTVDSNTNTNIFPTVDSNTNTALCPGACRPHSPNANAPSLAASLRMFPLAPQGQAGPTVVQAVPPAPSQDEPVAPSPEELRIAALARTHPMVDGEGVVQVTTLMFRGIPRRFTSDDLVAEIEALVPHAAWDFISLPWDSEKPSNLGFAFINFTAPEHAEKVRSSLNGQRWKLAPGGKPVIVMTAHVQGLGPNVRHIAGNISEKVDEDRRPLVRLLGAFVPFRAAVALFDLNQAPEESNRSSAGSSVGPACSISSAPATLTSFAVPNPPPSLPSSAHTEPSLPSSGQQSTSHNGVRPSPASGPCCNPALSVHTNVVEADHSSTGRQESKGTMGHVLSSSSGSSRHSPMPAHIHSVSALSFQSHCEADTSDLYSEEPSGRRSRQAVSSKRVPGYSSAARPVAKQAAGQDQNRTDTSPGALRRRRLAPVPKGASSAVVSDGAVQLYSWGAPVHAEQRIYHSY